MAGEISPSHALRKWFAHDPKKWAAFKKKYARELESKKGLLQQVRQLEKQHGTVTLLYSAKDEEYNQAAALRCFLRKKRRP